MAVICGGFSASFAMYLHTGDVLASVGEPSYSSSSVSSGASVGLENSI